MKFSPDEVFAEIERQAPTFGIDPKIAKAFLLAENTADGVLKSGSELRGDRVSKAKARGLFQTLPSTEEALKRQGFLPSGWQFNSGDMLGQVTAGLAAMKEMRSRQSDPDDVLELGAMYNGGTAPWRAYREGNLAGIPRDTQGYFKKLQTALGLEQKPMGAQAIEKAAAAGVASNPVSTSASTSRTTSTRSSLFDPTAFAAAMNSTMELIRSGGSIDTAMEELGRAAASRKEAEAAQQAAIGQYSIDAGAAVVAKTAIDATNAAQRRDTLRIANLDPAEINNRFNQTSELINRLDPFREQLGTEIDRRQSIGFFDNPLEFLVNSVRLPGMIGEYNTVVRKQNRAAESLKELQGLAGTQQALTASIDADVITAAGRFAAATEASKAQEVLARAQAEAAGAVGRDAANAAALAGQRATAALSLAQLTKQIRMDNEGMSERDAARQAEKVQVDKINEYMELIGSETRYTPEQFKIIGSEQRTRLINAAGTGVIAKTFSEAAANIDQMGNHNTIAATGDAAAMNWFRATINEAQKTTAEDTATAVAQSRITGKPVKTEEIRQGNLDRLQEVYQAQTTNMRTASENNPIKLAYPAIAKMEQFNGNPIAEFIKQYGPLAKDPLYQKIDEKVILDRITVGIEQGKYTSGQAAQFISDFYRKAIDIQAQRTKYALFGLDKPINGYTVAIPESGFFTLKRNSQNAGVINMADQAQVELYLIRNTAARVRATDAGPKNLMGSGVGGFR